MASRNTCGQSATWWPADSMWCRKSRSTDIFGRYLVKGRWCLGKFLLLPATSVWELLPVESSVAILFESFVNRLCFTDCRCALNIVIPLFLHSGRWLGMALMSLVDLEVLSLETSLQSSALASKYDRTRSNSGCECRCYINENQYPHYIKTNNYIVNHIYS